MLYKKILADLTRHATRCAPVYAPSCSLILAGTQYHTNAFRVLNGLGSNSIVINVLCVCVLSVQINLEWVHEDLRFCNLLLMCLNARARLHCAHTFSLKKSHPDFLKFYCSYNQTSPSSVAWTVCTQF